MDWLPRTIPLVLLVSMLGACVTLQVPPVPGVSSATAGATAPGQQATSATAISGKVTAPPGMVAAGGMNLVAAGGGNVTTGTGTGLVHDGGVALALPRNRGLFAIEEKPLANTEVFLADAAGQPLPGAKPVATGADGSFTLTGAPAGKAVVVAARVKDKNGKAAVLQTIAKVDAAGARADVNSSTTLVSASMVAESADALDRFNPATFRTAAEATAKNLRLEDLPDFSDRQAVVRRMNELAERVAEIQTAIAGLRKELQEIKASLDDLKSLIGGLASRQPTGGQTQPGGPSGGMPPGGCDGMFGFMDENGDGAIVPDEWLKRFPNEGPGAPAAIEVFRLVDGSRDGKISKLEFVPQCERHQATGGAAQRPPGIAPGPNAPGRPGPRPGEFGPGPNVAPDCTEIYKRFDADADAKLTKGEWDAMQRSSPNGGAPPEAFMGMDVNADGSLTLEEFRAQCERMR